MKNIKRWMVRKLGGLFLDELPPNIQMQIMKYYVQMRIDRDAFNLINNGFKTPPQA